MSFNSYAFLFFLPVVFLVYWLGLRTIRGRNVWIILASFFFYGYWSVKFLMLMVGVIAVSFAAGRVLDTMISRDPGARRAKLAVVWTVAAVNLGVLSLFKYYDFFLDSLREAMGVLGFTLDSVSLDLVLPIGISFYVFQALAYVIDVYRGTVKATRDPISYFAFISFFPQLVAGPIERAADLLPQFERQRTFDYAMAVDGCRRILVGLFKKVVIADNCARVVDYVYGSWDQCNTSTLIFGMVIYSFQIYCDFAGYSDIAIGSARLFGIRLRQNFATPNLARNIPEFWSRWHISLSHWFRDYVYIPMGGGRVSRAKKLRNIFVVFALTGLWHGANFTFVAWGLAHAVYQIPVVLRKKKRPRDKRVVAYDRERPTFREVSAIVWTFFLVALSRVFFRSQTMADAWGYITRMFTQFDFGPIECAKWPAVWCLLLVVAEWVYRRKEHVLELSGNGLMRYRLARWTLYYAMIACILLFPGTDKAFIYFQF